MYVYGAASGFRDYCKRALGFGVIDINVSDDQADDRIDEALQYFAQYQGLQKCPAALLRNNAATFLTFSGTDF